MGHFKNEQIEIANWLNSERNYEDGVYLYQKYGKNPILKRLFPGREKFHADKLAYELGKLIGLSFNQIQETKETPPDNPNPSDNFIDKTIGKTEEFIKEPAEYAGDSAGEAIQAAKEAQAAATKATNTAETLGAMVTDNPVPAGNYPHVINRIIAESSRLYNERAMLKKQQNAIPDENTPENMERRKAIIKNIDSISDRLEVLYTAKKAYLENNILPEEQQLFPDPTQRNDQDQDIDTGQLIITRNNLRSSITRARNMLEYQTQKKGSKPNPMPDCPRRKELEARIAGKEKELAEIEIKLKDADRPAKPE